MDGITLNILRCADGKLYTGLTRLEVEERVSEHQNGLSAFTRPRRPVALIFSERYLSITDGIAAERRLKGWTRVHKARLHRRRMGPPAAARPAADVVARRRGQGQRASWCETRSALLTMRGGMRWMGFKRNHAFAHA